MSSGRKLGRLPKVRRMLFRNLTTSLIKHDKIRTTLPKAKSLVPFVDRMITLAKRGTVHSRNRCARWILEKEVLQKCWSELPKRMEGRNGGYTRIIKLGRRKGDGAPLCYIGFVDVLPSRNEIEGFPGTQAIFEQEHARRTSQLLLENSTTPKL
ncbi:50S ribosomal protein L17 [Balamuthia mandrillaris]